MLIVIGNRLPPLDDRDGGGSRPRPEPAPPGIDRVLDRRLGQDDVISSPP